MTSIAANLQHVRERLWRACEAASRDSAEVTLLAVSKTFGADAVRQAHAAGQHAFGENYVQEGVDKIAAVAAHLPRELLQWHCIGPLQSNKTRQVATHFDWVQSVDRLKIAQRLSEQRPPGLAPLNVLLQVNISGEGSKSGVAQADVETLARAVGQLPGLKLRGLMAIPEPEADAALQRAGRLGDGVNPGKLPNERQTRLIEVLAAAAVDAGRDPEGDADAHCHEGGWEE